MARVPSPAHPTTSHPSIFNLVTSLSRTWSVSSTTRTLIGLVLEFIQQPVQRAPGDAVSGAIAASPDEGVAGGDGVIVVLRGDTPLLRPAPLAALVRQHRVAVAAGAVLAARLSDPSGYG